MLTIIIAGFVLVIFFGLGLIFYAQRQSTALNTGKERKPVQMVEKRGSFRIDGHVKELIRLDGVEEGVIRSVGRYFMLARLTGTNFSVISEDDQFAKEGALIRIFNNIDFALKFVSNTIVSDMDVAVQRVDDALNRLRPDEPGYDGILNYSQMYAGALEQMRQERMVLTNQSWLVIEFTGDEDDPVRTLQERMKLLQDSLRGQVGIMLEPLVTVDDILNAVGQIISPNRISRPSEMLNAGVGESIKSNFIQKISSKAKREN